MLQLLLPILFLKLLLMNVIFMGDNDCFELSLTSVGLMVFCISV